MDVFSFSWTHGNNWLVPLPKLAAREFHKYVYDRASATIVIPEWTSAPFWPLVTSYNKHIRDIQKLPKANLVITGRTSRGIFSKRPLDFDLLAIRFEFTA